MCPVLRINRILKKQDGANECHLRNSCIMRNGESTIMLNPGFPVLTSRPTKTSTVCVDFEGKLVGGDDDLSTSDRSATQLSDCPVSRDVRLFELGALKWWGSIRFRGRQLTSGPSRIFLLGHAGRGFWAFVQCTISYSRSDHRINDRCECECIYRPFSIYIGGLGACLRDCWIIECPLRS